MGAVKDVTSAILPYAMLAGVAAVIYIKRDAIVNWLKGTLVPDSLVTDTDGDNWNDAGTGVIDVNKPLWEGSLIGINPFTGKSWFYKETGIDTSVPGTTPGRITDALNPSGNPVQTLTVTQDNMCDWEPWKSSDLCAPVSSLTVHSLATPAPTGVPQSEYDNRMINAIVAAQGVSYQVAEAYYNNTYGLSFHEWNTKVFQSPEFAQKVGIPELTYTNVYARAAQNMPGGIYVGANLNPYVPQNDPDYTTIYNPSSGAMWSGSSSSTSYLMGDSPEAAAWRARYL